MAIAKSKGKIVTITVWCRDVVEHLDGVSRIDTPGLLGAAKGWGKHWL